MGFIIVLFNGLFLSLMVYISFYYINGFIIIFINLMGFYFVFFFILLMGLYFFISLMGF